MHTYKALLHIQKKKLTQEKKPIFGIIGKKRGFFHLRKRSGKMKNPRGVEGGGLARDLYFLKQKMRVRSSARIGLHESGRDLVSMTMVVSALTGQVSCDVFSTGRSEGYVEEGQGNYSDVPGTRYLRKGNDLGRR